MPERDIDAAIQHIENAADEIEALVSRVEGLQASRRWLTLALVALAVVIVLLVVGGVRQQDTVRRLDTTIERQEADREENRLVVCRGRNSSYVAGRNDLTNTLSFVVGEADDPASARALFDRLMAEAWTPIESFHSDCVVDGVLTADDYGEIVPDGLPIEIPPQGD